MKILLVSEFFYPHWTGIVKSFVNLSQILADLNHTVTVLTVRFDVKLKKEELYKKITVIRENYLLRISRTYYSLLIVFRYFLIVKDYDRIIINSPNSNILFFTLIGKIFGKKIIIFHQGDLILPRRTGNQFFHRLLEIIFDINTIIAFYLSDKISTYTKDYAKNSRVMKFFLKKFIPLIPPFKNYSQIKSDKKIFLKLNQLKKKYYLVGFAGRFVEEKGFDILLKSIPFVLKKTKKVRFVFAGETNIFYEKFYQHLIPEIKKYKNYLIFLGMLDDKQLKSFYRSLDIFVLSSRSDCFSLVQIEAMLNRIPVIAPNIPGARIPVKKTGFGLLFEKENYQDLAHKIVYLLKNKKQFLSHYPNVLKFLKSASNEKRINQFIG
jgi:glycosyltransferase involved in cell wall biosynthesis